MSSTTASLATMAPTDLAPTDLAPTDLALTDLALTDLEPTTVLLGLVLAALVVLVTTVRNRNRTRDRHRSRTRGGVRRPSRTRTTRAPAVGDVWWADVPFEDASGSKDRPVVVVETHGLRVVGLYVTSTDKSGRPGWLPMPRQGWGSGTGRSWLRTDRRVVLDPHRLRRYAGPCPTSVRKALRL